MPRSAGSDICPPPCGLSRAGLTILCHRRASESSILPGAASSSPCPSFTHSRQASGSTAHCNSRPRAGSWPCRTQQEKRVFPSLPRGVCGPSEKRCGPQKA